MNMGQRDGVTDLTDWGAPDDGRVGDEPAVGTFAEELGCVLTLRGLSQLGAGRRCGLNHSHVSRLLSGKRRPSGTTVARICERLQATPAERFRLYVAAGYLPPAMPGIWMRLGEMFSEESLAGGC